jgi:hypothetical protein
LSTKERELSIGVAFILELKAVAERGSRSTLLLPFASSTTVKTSKVSVSTAVVLIGHTLRLGGTPDRSERIQRAAICFSRNTGVLVWAEYWLVCKESTSTTTLVRGSNTLFSSLITSCYSQCGQWT